MKITRLLSVAGVAATILSGQNLSAHSYTAAVGGQIGMSFAGGISRKEAEKVNQIKKDAIKNFNDTNKAGVNVPFNGRIIMGINFGEKGEEIVGVEGHVDFGRWAKTTKEKSSEQDEQHNQKSGQKSNTHGYKGIVAGIAIKLLFGKFDGGNFFAKAGIDLRKGLFPFFIDNDEKKETNHLSSEEVKDKEELKKRKEFYKKNLNSGFDIAPKVAIGIELMERVVYLEVEAIWWMLDQVPKNSNNNDSIASYHLKNGVDISLGVGVNLIPLFS